MILLQKKGFKEARQSLRSIFLLLNLNSGYVILLLNSVFIRNFSENFTEQ